MVEVARLEAIRRRVEGERNLALRQGIAVGPPEEGDEDLAAQACVFRIPVDIEKLRVTARRAVLKHIEPPRIVAAADRHVVRHDVDDHAEAGVPERADQAPEGLLAAELRIDPRGINHVIAVHRTRPRRHDRRSIEMTDVERGQIGHLAHGVVEGESLVELQAHGCAWRVHDALRRLSHLARARTTGSSKISSAASA